MLAVAARGEDFSAVAEALEPLGLGFELRRRFGAALDPVVLAFLGDDGTGNESAPELGMPLAVKGIRHDSAGLLCKRSQGHEP